MWSPIDAGSGAPVHGQVAFRCSKPVNTTAVGLVFLVAFTAFGMFDLSPDCNKRCFAHAGSGSKQGPDHKSFCSRGVCLD